MLASCLIAAACTSTTPNIEPALDQSPIAEAPTPPPPPPPPTLSDGSLIQPCDVTLDDMACIEGGSFVRGFDGAETCPQPENSADRPPHHSAAEVELSTFFMDLQEVTYRDYKACEAEKRCDPAGPLYRDFDRPTQPHMGANWYEAKAYCKAQGKHLPTEAEWEAAARGPDGELHPWGDAPGTCELAVIMNAEGKRSCGVDKLHGQAHKGRTLEVRSRPAARYGIHDMAGNAEEWIADWFSADLDACGEACLGIDPRGPCDGAEPCKDHARKLVKGGSWYWPSECATGYNRRPHVPNNKPYHHFGFRCAASFAEAQAIASQRAQTEQPNPDITE